MTYDDMITVIQAKKNGQVIQRRRKPIIGVDWIQPEDVTGDIGLNFEYYDYRVKPEPPEPRTFWIYPLGDGYQITESPEEAKILAGVIHVREVLE